MAEASVRELSIADLIARKLQEDIVLGRRHPRERLVEQDLCTAFDTHRGDVRLALFELEKMGIVEHIPNRGAIVRDLKPIVYNLKDYLVCNIEAVDNDPPACSGARSADKSGDDSRGGIQCPFHGICRLRAAFCSAQHLR